MMIIWLAFISLWMTCQAMNNWMYVVEDEIFCLRCVGFGRCRKTWTTL